MSVLGSAVPAGAPRRGTATRRGRAARSFTALALCWCTALILGTASAQAAEAPVITSITPEIADIGYGPLGESSSVREVTISGENLGEATLTSPRFALSKEPDPEYEVIEDTGTRLVALVQIGAVPAVQTLLVHTPAGTASTQITYVPPPGVYPVIGRCARVTTSEGGYHDGKCSKPDPTSHGKYEWTPGLLDDHISFSSGAIEIAARSGAVKCAGSGGSGLLAGTSEIVDVRLSFHGCTQAAASCSSAGTPGEIETEALYVDLAWNAKTYPAKKDPVLGIFPVARDGAIAQFTCGSTPLALAGLQLGALKPGKPAATTQVPLAIKKGISAVSGIDWVGWGINDAGPALYAESLAFPETAPLSGTLTIGAAEPFIVNPKL